MVFLTSILQTIRARNGPNPDETECQERDFSCFVLALSLRNPHHSRPLCLRFLTTHLTEPCIELLVTTAAHIRPCADTSQSPHHSHDVHASRPLISSPSEVQTQEGSCSNDHLHLTDRSSTFAEATHHVTVRMSAKRGLKGREDRFRW